MRRTILLSLFTLLALSAASDACAQHRGGAGSGVARRGFVRSRARATSPRGSGYASLPYGSGDANDYGLQDYAPQPAPFDQPPPPFVQQPAPPVVAPPGHTVITEYKWPAAGEGSSASAHSKASEPESPPIAIVLKDGSTLSAVAVFASDDGLHYVDSDERHLRISMSEVDRAATLKLNRARNVNVYLPSAQ